MNLLNLCQIRPAGSLSNVSYCRHHRIW